MTKYILTENEIKRIVKESIQEYIEKFRKEVFDLSKITPEMAEKQFVDYATMEPVGFTVLNYNKIEEDVNYSRPLSEVRADMMAKYQWDTWQFVVTQISNNIEIVLLIPDYNQNIPTIISDMNKNGYFKGYERSVLINNLPYKELRFEPLYQESERNTVINMGMIFHSTYKNNIPNILQNGLIPDSKNPKFTYSKRVYFSKFTSDIRKICDITVQLANINHKNVLDYCIITIDTKKIPDNVDFYFDPIYENGIFTNDIIPTECIMSVKTFKEVANFCGYKF